MSQPSRPHERGPAQRTRRQFKIEQIQQLEDLCLLAPFIPTNAMVAAFTPLANQPNTQNLGTVNITTGGTLATSAAAYTSVSELTPTSSFGGDIVRIKAGPGGDFGKGIYAISRGAGGNTGAVNRPGVIYRVDPATGKASVFFDLNTVLANIEPGGTAANSFGADTGLVNWYDITFDPEGYFDGKTSMFVSSVDRLDPNKNVIFRIGSDGSFLGAYIKFTEGAGAGQFSRAPSAVIVPPPEQQTILRGLVMGDGSGTSSSSFSTGFVGLFFDANQFRPGTDLNSPNLPPGVTATGLTFGPQVGLTSTSTNTRYASPVYAVFTDFGTPQVPGVVPGQPGLSGVQGLSGDFLIRDPANLGGNVLPFPSIPTTIPPGFTGQNAATVTIATTASGDTYGLDRLSAAGTPYRRFQDIAFDAYGYFSYGTTVTVSAAGTLTVGEPVYAGSMFVADLATGLAVSVGVPAAAGTGNIAIPVQGFGSAGLTFDGKSQLDYQFPGGNLGGRIIRIQPNGTATVFAQGFNTSGSYFSDSFIDSSLSITFSADGTTLYAADDDGIWQFKTVTSLAGSTTGILTGLNDLRSLGVPYEGQDSAVAIVDTGIDGNTPSFRGRVAPGKNIVMGGRGDDDPTDAVSEPNGHGTLIAGVVAQFVPQATLVPVNIFTSNNPINTTQTATSSQLVYNGMGYVNKNPFVKDPIRPNKVDRVVSSVYGFGTNVTYDTEGSAFRRYPQVVLALKGQLAAMRRLGIAPIASAGQLGSPQTTTTATNLGDANGMSLPAVLSEMISVTGTYPFPYAEDARTGPDDPSPGAAPRPPAPILLTGSNRSVSTGATLLTTGSNSGVTVVTGDQILFKDKLLVASNRATGTDFVAPAIDVPTFRRTFIGDLNSFNVFRESGTSLSAGVASGSFALVASALNYWTSLAHTVDGATVDAYLTQPVGARSLTFGSHGVLDLSLYANPDGVNSILQWTAVPAVDEPNTLDTVNPDPLFGSEQFRNFSRIDVGNAIAAIEGAVALDYLFAHGAFDTIDGNKDGLITAQEIQTFTDNAATIGVPEQGAMARFLGGTARLPSVGTTAAGESPDNDDVLQRRFNFFDYAANGELKGVISIDRLKDLAHRLLPTPDSFTINDRQRASNVGWLLKAEPVRNYAGFQHLLPTYAWVPKRIAQKFAHRSPARFGVNRKELPGTANPLYTLFQAPRPKVAAAANNNNTNDRPNNPTPAASPANTTPTQPVAPTTTPTATTSTTPAVTDHGQQILEALRNMAGLPTPASSSTAAPTPASTTVSTATPVTTNPTPATPVPASSASDTPATPIAPAVPVATTTTTETQTPASSAANRPNVQAASARTPAQLRQLQLANQNSKDTGWDWVKNKLFNPGSWF